jgi:hypothetical protein
MEVAELSPLGTLDPEEGARLLRGAAKAYLSRLRAIAQASDPEDRALRILLGRLEAEASSRLGGWADGGESAATALVESFFPSLRYGFGEGRLNRESALYLAECLHEEAFWFYRTLAETTPDEGDRALLERAALAEWGRLAYLRSVLL